MPETSTLTGAEPAPAPDDSAVPAGADMIDNYENYCYRDDLDYLQDIHMLLMEKAKRALPAMTGCDFEPPALREIRTQIERRRERALRNGVELRLELLAERCRLDETEKLLAASLAIQQITGESAPSHSNKFFLALGDGELRGRLSVKKAASRLAEKKISGPLAANRFEHAPRLHPGIFRFLTEGAAFPEGFDAVREEPELSARDLAARALKRFPSPPALYRELSSRVTGQEEALRTISVAAFEHLVRTASGEPPERGTKKNILLAGPTGCGKTHIVTTLSGLLGFPCAVGDATSWTEEGYVGMNFDEVFHRLYLDAGREIEKAQAGIVFIDEVEKIAAAGGGNGGFDGRKDAGGAGVQRALLKALNGGTISISPGGAHTWSSRALEFDTAPTLIILGGAFTGIERISAARRKNHTLGFGAAKSDPDTRNTVFGTDDLVEYGLLREFAGRIPVVARLEQLTEKQLVRILAGGEHSLLAAVNREWRRHGLGFSFTPAALRAVAAAALEQGTGARSLRGTLNRITEPLIFANARTGRRRPKEIRITLRDLPELN